jgi:hypothetical protein
VAGGARGLLLTWPAFARLATGMPRHSSVLAIFDPHLWLLAPLVPIATTAFAAPGAAAHGQPRWPLKSN